MSINCREDLLNRQAKVNEEIKSYTCRVLVCSGTGCIASGAQKIYEEMEILCRDIDGVTVEMQKDVPHIGVIKTGCQGLCELGPLMRIEPYNYQYVHVQPEDCKEIVEKNRLEAVISMPSGVFKPYAGVSTAILIFTKTGHGGTDKVWFYDMEADGRSLDDKRTPVDENDIPDIIHRFKNLEQEQERSKTDKSFFVEKEEIVSNDYDLSINKYKEVEYIPVEYPPTEEIMAEIMKLDEQATKELLELKEMLKK